MKKLPSGDKKNKIIQAATSLFSEKGVRQTSVSQIAKQAGIGKGTIYYYYPTKTDILLDCYMRHITQKRSEAVNLIESGKQTVEGLQNVLRLISNESHQDPFVSMLFEEFKQDRLPEIDLCFKQSEKDAVKIVSRMLETGIGKGEIKDVPLPLTAFLLVRMMFAYNLDFPNTQKSDEEFLQLLEQMLLK